MAFSKEFQQISPGNVALHVNKAGQCIQRLASYKFPLEVEETEREAGKVMAGHFQNEFRRNRIGKNGECKTGIQKWFDSGNDEFALMKTLRKDISSARKSFDHRFPDGQES